MFNVLGNSQMKNVKYFVLLINPTFVTDIVSHNVRDKSRWIFEKNCGDEGKANCTCCNFTFDKTVHTFSAFLSHLKALLETLRLFIWSQKCSRHVYLDLHDYFRTWFIIKGKQEKEFHLRGSSLVASLLVHHPWCSARMFIY